MTSVDWSTAPESAEFYARGYFRKLIGEDHYYWCPAVSRWDRSFLSVFGIKSRSDYQSRPKEWPTEERISNIGQNGGDGLHYAQVETKSATDYLSAGMQILSERGNQYGSNSRECSFPQVAEAFNAITGNELSGSDVCMILALLKLVRQSAQPDRLHEDSLVDGVNYMALYAEMVGKELSK